MKSSHFQDANFITLPYPPNTFPPEHQVAGHFYGKGKTKLGLLKHIDGYILKPFQTSFRGENENKFYSAVFNPKCDNTLMLKLRKFIPYYLGIEELTINNEIIKFIKLDDVTSKFENPCILDIKMGKETYEANAPHEKKIYEKSKYPLLETTGIRVLGMKINNPYTQSSLYFDKEYGKKLSEPDILECLKIYFQFNDLNKNYIHHILDKFEKTLMEIKSWFQTQDIFHFYASSLLFVYEGAWKINNQFNCVKMIDFTHVHNLEDQGIDENYLFGLNYIINLLNLLNSNDNKAI